MTNRVRGRIQSNPNRLQSAGEAAPSDGHTSDAPDVAASKSSSSRQAESAGQWTSTTEQEAQLQRANVTGATRNPPDSSADLDAPSFSSLNLRLQSSGEENAQGPIHQAASAPQADEAGRSNPFGALQSAAEYANMVIQQATHGRVSLNGVARPGIAGWNEHSGKLEIQQGTARFEKARPQDFIDLFVARGTELPQGAQVVQKNVAGEMVRDINTLSSRGQDGADAAACEALTRGVVFDRVWVRRQDVKAPASKLQQEVESGYNALVKRLGGRVRADNLLARSDYEDSSLVEQKEILQHHQALPAGENT